MLALVKLYYRKMQLEALLHRYCEDMMLQKTRVKPTLCSGYPKFILHCSPLTAFIGLQEFGLHSFYLVYTKKNCMLSFPLKYRKSCTAGLYCRVQGYCIETSKKKIKSVGELKMTKQRG